jgi:hypothetical protein
MSCAKLLLQLQGGMGLKQLHVWGLALVAYEFYQAQLSCLHVFTEKSRPAAQLLTKNKQRKSLALIAYKIFAKTLASCLQQQFL